MNYAKLLKISSFFTWHIFLEVGKIQDIPSKIWQTLGDALTVVLAFISDLTLTAIFVVDGWEGRWVPHSLGASPRVYHILLSISCVLPTSKKICQVKKKFISNNLA